jgi:integrase
MTPQAIVVLRDRRKNSQKPREGDPRQLAACLIGRCPESKMLAVTSNPTKSVRRPKENLDAGYHTWTPEAVEQFERRHAIGTKARLALALFLFTGQRKSDVVLFGRQHVLDGMLKFTQQKKRNRHPVRLELPILPMLQNVIDASPCGNLTFLVTEFGKPFSAKGFSSKMRQWCNEAGLPHCTGHGLRKAGAVIAAHNGATPHQLMAIFGWRTLKEAERYTKAMEQRRIASGAMRLLIADRSGNKSG